MLKLAALGRVAFFGLLPAAASGGALAMPAILAVAGALSFRIRGLLPKPGAPTFSILCVALAAWALISAAWSPASASALAQAGRALATLVLGVLLVRAAIDSPEAQKLTRACTLAAFTVLALLLAIETIWAMPLNRAAQPLETDLVALARNPGRGSTVLLALFWGCAGAVLSAGGAWRWLALLALTAVMAGLAPQFDQLANAAAFAVGLAGFGLGLLAPRLALPAVCGGWALWLLGAPFAIPALTGSGLLPEGLPLSWAHRLGIWEYVSARIPEHILIGHGFDASRAVEGRIEVAGVSLPAVPLHPHSLSLQIWYELGIVGAGLAAAAFIAAGLALSRALAANRAAAAGACGALAALGLVANISYGAWQEWWLASLIAAAAAVGAARRASPG